MAQWQREHGLAFATQFSGRGILWDCWIKAVQQGEVIAQGSSIQIFGKQKAFDAAMDSLAVMLERKGHYDVSDK